MTIAIVMHWFSMSISAQVQRAENPSDAPTPVAAGLCESELPANIWVDPKLAAMVRQLLARSETFRRQCTEISASPRVSVAVRLFAKLSWMTRARAEIRHYGNGAVRAVIDVPVTREAPELIAHEFEHVVEQLGGLDLAALERQGGHGVTEAGEGAFETARAISAGRIAADEYYGWARPVAASAGAPGVIAVAATAAKPQTPRLAAAVRHTPR